MTNQTEHHAEAILRAAKPSAWIFRGPNGEEELHPSFVRTGDEPKDWTETPLYPASAILDAVQAERAAIVAWLQDPDTIVENMNLWVNRTKAGNITGRSMGELGTAAWFARNATNAIERGEHLPQDTPQ